MYTKFVSKPEGKRPCGTPVRRWKKILKRILEKWRVDVDWITVAQDRDQRWALVDTVMNLKVL